jgi:hypothetical protein
MRLTRHLLLALIFAAPGWNSPAPAAVPPVTMHVPRQVLAEALQKSLPVVLSRASESLGGTISVNRIDNLALAEQSISASLGLTGEDVQLNTKIGGYQIALNVGNVVIDFRIDAQLRFDETTQTLYIRPMITEIDQGGEQQNNEIGALVASLFHDQELPVTIDRLQPIVANTGAKQLVIHMRVRDVSVTPDGLYLEFTPNITTTPPAQ